MTKRSGRSAENDPGLSALMNSNTNAVCLVGKSWDFHVDVALGISNDENLSNISESASHFVEQKKEFMFDAEHFFDGYKANRPPAPEDLVPQFPLTREATKAFNIACEEMEGFEADDMIATIACQARDAGGRVTIISSDKDLMQLV